MKRYDFWYGDFGEAARGRFVEYESMKIEIKSILKGLGYIITDEELEVILNEEVE